MMQKLYLPGQQLLLGSDNVSTEADSKALPSNSVF